jgi:meiotically up-regulated gene 157 (Mug157) protein
MVALDAPRKKVVPTGSIEARWLVDEGEVPEYLAYAKKQPKMQALMEEQAKLRLEDEAKSAKAAAAEARRRMEV